MRCMTVSTTNDNTSLLPFHARSASECTEICSNLIIHLSDKFSGINGIHLSTKTFPKCQEKLEKQHVQSAETQEAKDMHHNYVWTW